MPDATPQRLGGGSQPRADGGFLWVSIVNGPVGSRRLGTSLGLNLLPAASKLCSFDCPYCECGYNTPRLPGSRWPSPDEVAHALRRALERLPAVPDWITFSGNGEPTLHPRFPVVVARVLAVRAELAPGARTAVLSNGLTAGQPAIRAALGALDARIMKLDPGPMERVNGVRYDVNRLVASYRALKPYTIQAMVTRGDGWDGAGPASLAPWLGLLARAEPDVVQLYSLARAPADPALQKISRERLNEMAHAIRQTLPRCIVDVF
jgi:wyosine [tRNA(Phe)-imidazoG37] synthetase (radical SAM superfamily)